MHFVAHAELQVAELAKICYAKSLLSCQAVKQKDAGRAGFVGCDRGNKIMIWFSKASGL